MGLYTFMLVCAPFAGGIGGGALQYNKSLGWRWSMYLAAILYGALFVLMLFFGKYSLSISSYMVIQLLKK